MTARNLGEMGEQLAGLWLASRGIVANRVNQDRTGWDLLLEFPMHPGMVDRVPLDRAAPPVQCLLQVKATDARRRRLPVKLDNWVRFAKTPFPAFFLIMEFDAGAECQRAFLVHTGEQEIRRVLHRLRELSLEESPASLHKHHLALTYSGADELSSLDGAGLEQAILRHIGPDTDAYGQEKRRLLRRAGYEEKAAEFNMRLILPPDDPAGHLLDFVLGRKPGLEFTNGEIWDVRFGIRAAEPREILSEGTILEWGSHVQEAELVFRSAARKEVSLRAKSHSPRVLAGIVPDEALRYRISTPFFEFVAPFAERADASVRFTFPGADDEHPLCDLAEFAELLHLLSDAADASQPVVMEMRIGKFPPSPIEIGVPPSTITPQMIEWARVVRHAWRVAMHLGLTPTLPVSGHQLWDQADVLEKAHIALAQIPDNIRWYFSSRSPEGESGTDVCIPFVLGITLGDRRIVLPVVFFGKLINTGRTTEHGYYYEVNVTHRRVEGEHLLPRGGRLDRGYRDVVLMELEANYEAEYYVLPWWRIKDEPET